VRTRSEFSEESIRQSDAALLFVKLRKMIASDTQSTDTILGIIAVAAQSLTEATGAAIAMPRDGAVVCVGRSGETAPELGDQLNIDSGISGECLRTGVSLRCDDASRDFHVDAEVCRQLGLQSIAVVPLRGQHGRVGVLETFSTHSYAFDEKKMELLERLAGLAEAAWARGAVTEAAANEKDLKTEDLEIEDLKASEVATTMAAPMAEAPVAEIPVHQEEASPVAVVVPLAEIRQALASAAPATSRISGRWRFAAIAAAAVLALALLSMAGWRAWYKASVSSNPSPRPPSSQIAPATSESAAGEAVASTPDVVRPSPARLLHPPSDANVTVPDDVIRRQRQGKPAGTTSASGSGSNPDELPQITASNTGAAGFASPADLGKVLAPAPALPSLNVPISQGTAGGDLIHKVQPIYPSEARRRRLDGKVVMDAVINVQGSVEDLKLVSGDPLLAQAAMDAVRQWRYSPFSLNGKTIPKPTRITINFIAPQ
jgi:periplasmic protein TonB